jgi:predicted TIM-barrel fold metal-dependent hydrolase
MWRFDRAWAKLRTETPHVDRPPSEIIRESFWISTQPMEEPEPPDQFAVLLEQLAMPDRLMFATDYPHWDFDAPDRAIPIRLDPALRNAIMRENAIALYGFADRPRVS